MANLIQNILKRSIIILFIISFILILSFTGLVYSEYVTLNKENPSQGSTAKNSPQDYVKQDQIIVNNDYVLINVKNADWSQYADTHSMEPTLSSKSNGIEIVPKCDEIESGDIIVYEANWASKALVVHRVMTVQEDASGKYFTLKGDNNPVVDPEKVRCSQIKYQVIGIIY